MTTLPYYSTPHRQRYVTRTVHADETQSRLMVNHSRPGIWTVQNQGALNKWGHFANLKLLQWF